jgi:hypothetical protein
MIAVAGGKLMSEPLWYVTKDGDASCLELYERHYARYCQSARKVRQFVGPGEHIVLRTGDCDAMFVWRKFIDDSGQQGVNCAIFRNEGQEQSSILIRQADAIADHVWPRQRHYTFVNPQAIRSSNPGFCFMAAGWRRCGQTGTGLRILERCAAGYD